LQLVLRIPRFSPFAPFPFADIDGMETLARLI
jgi:hypothetical protein